MVGPVVKAAVALGRMPQLAWLRIHGGNNTTSLKVRVS